MISRNKKEKSLNLLILVLVLICAGLLLADYADNKRTSESLRAISLQRQIEDQLEEQERMGKIANSSFYQKLANGYDVEILIVGDSIGAGSGASASEFTWANRLSKAIWTEYGAKVKLTNVSMGGNASHAGYVRTMALTDGLAYDLVIFCYGQNDSTTNFGLYYESMIRAVQKKYPQASIIAIMESSQRGYTEKMQMIQLLAAHYDIPLVDTIAPFTNAYDELVKDGVHPNDEGYQVYYEQVMGMIRKCVEENRGFDLAGVEPMDSRVTVFDTFQWYGKECFTRTGNSYSLPLEAQGEILSIDYYFVPGKNTCRVLVDGIEYAAPETVFNYDFSQRRILIVNDWMQDVAVNVKNEIKIVFDETDSGTEQADKFQGIAISGL